MAIELLKPTDGNLYVDRNHPSANIQGTPIRHYENMSSQIHTPQEMYKQRITPDPQTDIAGKPYFSTTFFSAFTEGPRYGSQSYNKDPVKGMYH